MQKSLCIKLKRLVKNKPAILSSFANSKDLPEHLFIHFMSFNAKNTFDKEV